MYKDHPPRKKRWGLLKRSQSDRHLSDESSRRAPSESELSSQASLSKERPGLFRKLFVKNPSASSAGQYPDAAPMASSSSTPDPICDHPNEGPSLHTTVLAPELSPEPATNSGIAEVHHQTELPDPNERIAGARKAAAGMSNFSGIVHNAASAIDNVQSGIDTINKFSSIIEPLKVFNSIADRIANIHPYAQVVMSILTCASKMILDQAKLDNAVCELLDKVSEVYTFMKEDGRLAEISSMQALYGKIARQTLECADFIVHYSETKSAWKRLGKHIFDETDIAIQSYSNVLDRLMQQLRDQAVRDTVVNVHRLVEDVDFKDMVYVDGAGRDTSKQCLPGTRENILSEIKIWIDTIGEDVPRVFWLSGTAGKGKSAIAHTIANWFLERGDPGSCFCFDRTREADRRHEKIFTTIARDLADRDPIVRRVLASAVRDDNELRHTKDVTKQWKELILGPVDAVLNVVDAPVLLVVDALDESGQEHTREHILRMLSGTLDPFSSELTNLPSNLRILVTSRLLEDISDVLTTASHVRHVSMDSLPTTSTENDIELYISKKLAGPRSAFGDGHFKALAQKSDGLFEWARLACEYIKGTNKAGVEPMDRFEDVIVGTSDSRTGTHLLDDMYERILVEIMPEDRKAMVRVRSVMGQILASLQPLSMAALTAMRLQIPGVAGSYKVERVIAPLGSLVTGTTDSHTPIRPLHASFYDFLTDKSRSKKFFIDVSVAQSDLAFASLQVMKERLRFNICSLESSYLPNSAVPSLEKRVKESIPAELSYSCLFWGTHVRATPFQSLLAKEVGDFFDGERLLFWLEALSLMKDLSSSVVTLSSIADWLTGHAEFTDIRNVIVDTHRFVRTFAPAILHSTPHLYLSALPFSPTQSKIFKKFAAKFTRIPRVVAGHVVQWPQMEKILHLNDSVCAVAISPDGRRIVCGSQNAIQVWDIETGEALGVPFQGHTWITSVAISSDGKHVVSGSRVGSIQVWDADTGKASVTPLLGHEFSVNSVAITPDGNRIVSGSGDKTIRVWDMMTGAALGAPLIGHTHEVHAIAITQNGNRIVSGSSDDTIRIWDAMTGVALGAPLYGHNACVYSVAITPDGNRIVSASRDNSIRVWDANTGKALVAPLLGHTDNVTSVAISPDGNRIVSGSYDKSIRVWDVDTGKVLDAPLIGHTHDVNSVAITPDGNRIVSGSYVRSIRVWDMNVGKTLVVPPPGHADDISSVTITLDGNYIVSGSRDKSIRVWDADTGKASVSSLQGHTDMVYSVTTLPDGRIVSGSYDKTIRVWGAETGRAPVAPLLWRDSPKVQSVAISSDVNRIVSSSYDGIIVAMEKILQGDAHINAFAISPDGRRIVSESGLSDGTIQMWDMETGEEIGAPLVGHTNWIGSLAITPDGNYIVSGSYDHSIRVWDVDTRKTLVAPLLGHTGGINSVAITPDGGRVVSGSNDETVRVWDAKTGVILGTPLQGHTGSVNSVAITPDGSRAVSGSDDKTIRVWDATTGAAFGAPIQGHTGHVNSVAITPDGNRVVSGSDDKTIRVWALDYLNWSRVFEAPVITFSCNPTHALCSSFLQDFRSISITSLAPTEEGWVVGPEGRLLLCIPMNLHPVVYVPGNTLVIPTNALQLDLSHFVHGTSWQGCWEESAASVPSL